MANGNRWLVKALLSLFACGILLPAGRALAQSSSGGPADVERAFEQATALHQAGKLEEAIRGYLAILANHPARADVRSNLGAAYSRLGRYEDAVAQYKQALALQDQNQTIRFNLALAYYKSALFAEAAAEWTRFLAAVPANLPERLNAVLLLADCQVRLGEYKKAIELLTPLEAADPDGPNGRAVAYLLGNALIGDGQLDKGQLVIDRVFRDENSAEARLLMGSILLLMDDGPGAVKELDRALALNPKLPSLRAWYGRAMMRLGDSEKAKEYFKSELADNPTDFDSNLYHGILLRQDKQFEEAFGYLSRAVQLRPKEQYARYHLGAVLAALGKPDEARPLLEGVVSEHPEFSEARALLASVYYRLNRKADGDRERAIVQKLDSEQQAKQPGAQNGSNQAAPVKSP
ncbi:MAG TPA: tetratricopeptide repeat protein [Pyrinomonadaceae bacterium]|nr:tetratricopeptide repeat protein [Pyrinomonadaceae bacterium]